MHIHRDLAEVPHAAKGCVVALGNFDGLHRGHQRILARTRELARKDGACFGVVTFSPHPRRFFKSDAPPFLLLPFHHKARLLRHYGVEHLFVLRFNEAFSRWPAERFVEEALVQRLGVSQVVIGEDFVFGHRRGGNAALLERYAAQGAFAISRIAPVGQGEQLYSSSLARSYVQHGHMEAASGVLGQHYTVLGRVIHGEKKGRELGYPTANLRLPSHILTPPYGVYAARLRSEPDGQSDINEWMDGVASFGVRPTVAEKGLPLLEVHLFDRDIDLYGARVAVELVKFLRPERKFDSLPAMVAQMDDDGAAAKRVLGHTP